MVLILTTLLFSVGSHFHYIKHAKADGTVTFAVIIQRLIDIVPAQILFVGMNFVSLLFTENYYALCSSTFRK